MTKDLEDNGYYFLYLPIEDQIRDLFCNEKLKNYLTNRDIGRNTQSANISDITSSVLYRELVEQHNFSSNDLSLTWNTDGVPVFKSSRFSIWPIQSSINELPPHLRGKHILLNGLWSGDKKPAMNTFLKPFVDECKQLEENGFAIDSEHEKRKVFAMVLSADSPARAIVRNSKQFNGKHGCDWCEFPGETVDNGGPPTRYYPYRGPQKMRTATKQVKYALKAVRTNEPVKGVKGLG